MDTGFPMNVHSACYTIVSIQDLRGLRQLHTEERVLWITDETNQLYSVPIGQKFFKTQTNIGEERILDFNGNKIYQLRKQKNGTI